MNSKIWFQWLLLIICITHKLCHAPTSRGSGGVFGLGRGRGGGDMWRGYIVMKREQEETGNKRHLSCPSPTPWSIIPPVSSWPGGGTARRRLLMRWLWACEVANCASWLSDAKWSGPSDHTLWEPGQRSYLQSDNQLAKLCMMRLWYQCIVL